MTNLNGKIRETIAFFRDNLPEDMNALLEQGAGEISALKIVERALKVGDQAPTFDLPKYGGGTASLAEYLREGPLVITFYRGVWCPYCNLQLKEYDDRIDEFRKLGANIVAMTAEKPGAVDILKTSGAPEDIVAQAVVSVQFDVLHDDGNSLARDFGLIFELPDAHKSVLKQIGVDIEALTGSTSYAFADPATYVIGQDGRIAYAFVPNNYRKRAEVDALTSALQSLQ